MKKTPIAALVAHCLWQNLADVVGKSCLNCHTPAVHSIMLSDAPGNRIRLFIAVDGHNLHHNFPGNVQQYAGNERPPMSVGFHAHHCALTLAGVYGTFLNWRVSEGGVQIPVRKFLFDSKLNGGSGSFIRRGETSLKSESTTFVRAGESLQIDAKEIHTVAVDKDETAAWLVFEGKGDPDYVPYTYSNADLEKHDAAGLYIPMSEGDIRQLLRLVDLL